MALLLFALGLLLLSGIALGIALYHRRKLDIEQDERLARRIAETTVQLTIESLHRGNGKPAGR